MKQLRTLLYILFSGGLLLSLGACYKDKGNYSYNMPEEPLLTNLDTAYSVYVGDSLIISPIVSMKTKANLVFDWKISTPFTGEKDVLFTGPVFRILFGLGANRYSAHLTITNTDNDIKYYHDFIVVGQTAFVTGTTVLSTEGGVTQLSFIKPDGTVQARIYGAVNPGEELPGDATQVLAAPQAYQPPIISYWVFGKSGENRGVQVDANTFKKLKYLSDNFFDVPDTTLNPGRMFVNPLGVISGDINGKLFGGTTSTWDQAPTYGMFGQGAVGDYVLSPEVVSNYTGTYGPGNYIGFDVDRRQFLRFNIYGDVTYYGSSYTVTGSAFDPTNVGMDLVHLQQINGGLCYAYCKDTDGRLFELKFNTSFNGPYEFNPMQKTLFAKPELITADTKWEATTSEVIYMTSNDKIYRYNPVNQEFKVLTTDMGGKTVTMLKVIDDGNTLVAGVDGTLYYLNISVGKYGDLIKKIDGIPGKPVDLAVRVQ